MAPASTAADDFTFIMTCLKHTAEKLPKPNFSEVAKEMGSKNENAAYQRHWAILKKWGLAGNTGKGRKGGAAPATNPITPQKRKSKNAAAVSEDQDEELDEPATPAKKAKPTPKKACATPIKDEDEDSEDGGVKLNGGEADEEAEGN